MSSEWTAGGSGVTFEQIGDKVAGTITFATIEDGVDLQGRPVRNRILDIKEDDGETRRLYVKKGIMSAELAKRLTENSLEGPRVGDRIAVVFESTKPSTKVGFNPVKVYSVAYKPGQVAVSQVGGNVGPAAADLI